MHVYVYVFEFNEKDDMKRGSKTNKECARMIEKTTKTKRMMREIIKEHIIDTDHNGTYFIEFTEWKKGLEIVHRH